VQIACRPRGTGHPHPPRFWTLPEAVRQAAEKDDAGARQARALGGGRTSCAQDEAGEGICDLDQRDADPALPSGLCPGSEPG